MTVRLLLCLLMLGAGGLSAVPTVVIDAGHGGEHDAGSDAAHNRSMSNNATSVVHHLLEKDLTLRLARLVAARGQSLLACCF